VKKYKQKGPMTVTVPLKITPRCGQEQDEKMEDGPLERHWNQRRSSRSQRENRMWPDGWWILGAL
jgi:hypothetical protein